MRIYHGWFVVAANMLASALVIGALSSSFGLFVIPVSAEYGLSRADMNSAMIFINVGTAMAAPLIGKFVDQYSNRLILALCALTLGVGLLVLGVTSSVWISIVALVVLIPIGLDGTCSITMSNMVVRWFSFYRTRAIALSAMGMSLGGVLLPPVVGYLIDDYGWRNSVLVISFGLTTMLLVFAWVLREWPGPQDIEPGCGENTYSAGEGTQSVEVEPRMTFSELLRSGAFWMLIGSTGLILALSSSIMISIVPMGIAGGISTVEATSLISVSSVAGIIVKLLIIYCGDHVNRAYLVSVAAILGAIMCTLALVSQSYLSLLVVAALTGIVWGGTAPLMLTMVIDLFGARSYGTVRGLISPVTLVANASCMRFAGEVYDRTGNYDLMFAVFSALMVVALIASSRLFGFYKKGSVISRVVN